MTDVQVYRISRERKISFSVIISSSIVLFGFLMVMPFLKGGWTQSGWVVLFFLTLPTQYTRTLLLQPTDSNIKKSKAALIFEHQFDLLEWLNRNVPNLGSVNSQQAIYQVLNDERSGKTKELRQWVLGSYFSERHFGYIDSNRL